MKKLNVKRPGPDATPEEIAEWKRMHAELGQETASKLRRIMSRRAPPAPPIIRRGKGTLGFMRDEIL